MVWLKRLGSACLWASLIAAGSLIYTHFAKKWVMSGYPALPITALQPPDERAQQQQRGQHPASSGRTVYDNYYQQNDNRKSSGPLDFYEG